MPSLLASRKEQSNLFHDRLGYTRLLCENGLARRIWHGAPRETLIPVRFLRHFPHGFVKVVHLVGGGKATSEEGLPLTARETPWEGSGKIV